MLRRMRNSNGQSTLEYAILIGVIVAGLIGMQVYLKRGFSGRLKDSADQMGTQFSVGQTTEHSTTHSVTHSTENTARGTTRTDILDQSTDSSGSAAVGGANVEYWFK